MYWYFDKHTIDLTYIPSSSTKSHDLGYFATPEELKVQYPVATAGDYATVGSTGSIWVWDTDSPDWKDTAVVGPVKSVNGMADDVTVRTFDVGLYTLLNPNYAYLEYLQSDGNQYIDTGINFDTNNITGTLDFQFTATTTSSEGWIVGALQMERLAGMEGGIFKNSFFNERGVAYSQTANVLARTQATINCAGQEIPNMNIYLFSRNYPDTANSAKAKIYSATFTKNNVLVRNFLPAKRKSDNTLGLYDSVTDTFFTNSGTGTFTAGPEVVDYAGKIVQYLGETTEDYTQGSHYICKQVESNYVWTYLPLTDGTVHLAGEETITGDKNFTGLVRKNGNELVSVVDYASETFAGVGKVDPEYGIDLDSASKSFTVVAATEAEITARTNSVNPIVPATLNKAISVMFPVMSPVDYEEITTKDPFLFYATSTDLTGSYLLNSAGEYLLDANGEDLLSKNL